MLAPTGCPTGTSNNLPLFPYGAPSPSSYGAVHPILYNSLLSATSLPPVTLPRGAQFKRASLVPSRHLFTNTSHDLLAPSSSLLCCSRAFTRAYSSTRRRRVEERSMMIDSQKRKRKEEERKDTSSRLLEFFLFFFLFFPQTLLATFRPSTFDVHRRWTRRDETEWNEADAITRRPVTSFFFFLSSSPRIHATPRNLGIKARPSLGCDAILIATPSSKRGRARVGRSIGRQLLPPRIENQIIRSKDRRRSLFRSISAGP